MLKLQLKRRAKIIHFDTFILKFFEELIDYMARLKAQRKDKILPGRTLEGGGRGLILQSASIYTIQKVYIQKFGCNFRHQSSLRIATHVLNLGESKQQNMGGGSD